jgi:hypothetical protein
MMNRTYEITSYTYHCVRAEFLFYIEDGVTEYLIMLHVTNPCFLL